MGGTGWGMNFHGWAERIFLSISRAVQRKTISASGCLRLRYWAIDMPGYKWPPLPPPAKMYSGFVFMLDMIRNVGGGLKRNIF